MVIMEAEHIKNTGTTGTTGTPPTPTTPLSTVNFPQNNSKPTLSNRFELNRCGAPRFKRSNHRNHVRYFH